MMDANTKEHMQAKTPLVHIIVFHQPSNYPIKHAYCALAHKRVQANNQIIHNIVFHHPRQHPIHHALSKTRLFIVLQSTHQILQDIEAIILFHILVIFVARPLQGNEIMVHKFQWKFKKSMLNLVLTPCYLPRKNMYI